MTLKVKDLFLEHLTSPVRCHYCGCLLQRKNVIAEHAIPRARGGSDGLTNLVPSCRMCDHHKGPLTADEFRVVRLDHAARKALLAEVHAQLRAG